ncbi:MAG: radical SAM family heme chaperone HemW, partial [bacterium]|nr:radical SAM family heme chaperone HemW [bacterium]
MPQWLYFHMPFCRRKCPYCDFFKRILRSTDRERFVRALLSEIEQAAEFCWPPDSAIKTIYFGGGTPSLHPPEEIAWIIGAVQRLWGLDPKAEVTLEANPGLLTRELLCGWREAGVNRLSLGGQSFSARKLALLYRDHSVEQISEAVALAREAQFENISLDLIFGLPGETLEEWDSDLRAAFALQPEHVSLYNLEYHEATPYFRWRESGKITPLSEDLEAEMYLFTHDFFTARGFEHYEISNFARPGFRSRHNSACWEGKPYFGFGPSAHSFDGEALRWNNVADLTVYSSAIERGELPVESHTKLSAREQLEEWIALHLRTSDGISWSDTRNRWGGSIVEALWKRAEGL